MKIDKDDDRYEQTTTQSSFSPKQERKYVADFTYMADNYIKFDVSGYVDSLVKNIDEEIERQLAEAGFIKVVRCKDCKFWQDNNGGYPHEDCKWNHDETPDEDDYCSGGERR
jgi:hypothetical protein